MSSCKLVYFNSRGKAELVRLMFVAAGVEFEDVRVDKATEWPAFKPSAPFGQVPYLEFDGKKYAQSIAISNYLAREHNLYGKDNLEAFKIDEIVGLCCDFFPTFRKIVFAADDSAKLTMADLAVFNMVDYAVKLNPEALNDFPKVAAHFKKVGSNERIAAYIKNRKDTVI